MHRLSTWDGWTKLGALATAVAAVGALVLTSSSVRVSSEQQRLAEQGQIAERFTKAVEQLGHENVHVRMGGLYLLEEFARTSERQRGVVFDVIGAFVREKAPMLQTCSEAVRNAQLPHEVARPPVEVQTALTVIGRRATPLPDIEIDLVRTCLAGTDLRKAALSGALLDGADLTGAKLSGASLRSAQLSDATLYEADLGVMGTGAAGRQAWQTNGSGPDLVVEVSDPRYPSVDLTDAQLARADLTRARLEGADLTGAYLGTAKLSGAFLVAARLTGATVNGAELFAANLSGADLNDVQMVRANLRAADLRYAQLRNGWLDSADLTDADLSGADLRGTDLSDAVLTGTYFGGEQPGCDTPTGHAAGDRIRLCTFSAGPWAAYDSETKWPEGFAPSWASPLPPR
ncbi:pentapeptide repeat-containing protein [Nocardia sp. NPDC127526]|uniref:pentapeptide repeat-containing protein n=1 Tax=Nocardia sp. NPDC127526 TaxID=3345393 RepID=UPI00362810AF